MHSRLLNVAVAVLVCVVLVGCARGGVLNPSATTDLHEALDVGCPVLAAIQTFGLPLNTYQTAAIVTLAAACPPNPPPTSALVAIGDIVAAYSTLQPLLNP